MTPFQQGFLKGRAVATEVMNFAENHCSPLAQHSPGMFPDIVPLQVRERRAWLRGFANGVLSVTDDPEARDEGDDNASPADPV